MMMFLQLSLRLVNYGRLEAAQRLARREVRPRRKRLSMAADQKKSGRAVCQLEYPWSLDWNWGTRCLLGGCAPHWTWAGLVED